jgi:methylated-DNA-[protein]-cysteine S-methyltransferase
MVIFRQIKLFAARLGWFGAAWGDQGLAALTFGHEDRNQARLDLQRLGTLEKPLGGYDDAWFDLIPRLRAYCDGQSDNFLDIPLDLTDLTDFRRRATLTCRQISWGNTCTYGELASRIGSPRAARAVGSVMARNRLPIVIPCHRVLGTAERLVGYSAPGGLDMKRRLLHLEGVRFFSATKGIPHA